MNERDPIPLAGTLAALPEHVRACIVAYGDARARAALASAPAGEPAPIDMVLYCPNCGKQHIDRANTLEDIIHAATGTVVDQLWTNPPHRSHLCHSCGIIWRPADVPTNGVRTVLTTGKADTWVGKAPFAAVASPPPQAPAPAGAMEDAERLAQVRDAITAYHVALDERRHGVVAAHDALDAIQVTLGMPWHQGVALAARQAGKGAAA